MTAATVTITAEVELPPHANDEDLMWVVIAALTERDAMSRYGVIITRRRTDMAQNYYFTADGSYGRAIDGCVIDTQHWTDSDWHDIESVSDWDRANVARYIAEGRGGRIMEMVDAPYAPADPTLQHVH